MNHKKELLRSLWVVTGDWLSGFMHGAAAINKWAELTVASRVEAFQANAK